MARAPQVVAFDLSTTMAFLRSAAVCRAMAENTKARWTPEMGNTVVNLMYNIMPWKARFGVMDVQQSPRRVLAEHTAYHYRHFVTRWLEETARGAAAAKRYLESINSIRLSDIENLRTLCHEVQQVNREALGQMATAIRGMAAVQMTGTIAVACLGAYAAIAIGGGVAVMAGTVATAHSVSNSVIKTWSSLSSASAVGVACEYGQGVGWELAKAKASDKLGDMSGKLYQQAGEEYLKERTLWDEACRKIEHYSRQAAQTSRKKVQRRAAQSASAAAAQRSAAASGMKGAVATGSRAAFYRNAIPVVFALWDSVEAVGDFGDVWAATAQ